MNTLNGYSKSTLTDNYILTAAGGHIPLGNASGNVPLSNGTVNTNLNSDLWDGKHWNDLKIGGRNYFPINFTSSHSGITKALEINGYIITTGESRVNRVYGLNFNGYSGDWTLQFEIKADTPTTAHVLICDIDADTNYGENSTINVTTEYVKHTFVFLNVNKYNVSTSYNGFIDIETDPGNTLYIKNVMLEKGTKASDWVPSIELYFRYEGSWSSSDTSKHADNAHGIVFAYPSHGVPGSWGTLVTFERTRQKAYNFQLHGTGSNTLHYRAYSADLGLKDWVEVLTSLSYTNYTVKKDGTGASGTWNINITGNASSTNRLLSTTHPIKSTAEDTVVNWGALGTSIHYLGSTAQVTDKPHTYGFILNVSNGDTEVHLLWLTQALGNLAHRGGNANGWEGTWRTILDSTNYSSILNSSYVTKDSLGSVRIRKDLGGNLSQFGTYQHKGPLEVGRSSNTMCLALGVTDDNYGYIQSKGNSITNTGSLILQPQNGELLYGQGKYKIWHAGNDGVGSGLDADLLDGLQLNDLVYRSAIAREAFTDHIFHNVQNINNSIIVETANTYPTVTTTNNSTTIDDSNIIWTLVAEGSVSQYLNVFDHNKTTYAPSNWIGLRYTVPISEYAELSLLYISHAYTGKTGYVVSVDFINASNVVTNYYKKLIEYLYTESCTIKFTNSSQTNTKIRITILKKDSDLPNLAISLICGYSARGGSQGVACNYGINYHGRYVFRPYINNVWSLGTSSYKFKDIYATTLYGNLNGSYINALTGYSKASSISSIVATDTLNTALGKLEYKADYVYSWLTSVADDDEYINKWGEIVEFLDSVKEGTDILDEFVTRKTELTITGKKTFSNEVYLRFSDATLKFYEIAGSAGASNGSETMCILTCFDQQDPKTSDYVTSYPLRTTLALQPRGGSVGIGTATPKQTLDVIGNIQISSKGSSKAPKLVIHEYYDGSNDWISEIVSDYWGQNVCSKSGFTHGLYIKLGRNLTFSNLNILDADKNPIARISKGLGHWFDGDLTVTESIHGINTYLVNTRYRRKDGTGDSMFIGDPAAVNSSYTTGGVILAYGGPLHFYTNGSKSFTALADLSVDFEKSIKIKTTTSTNYLTSGITIGGGDVSARYMTCYGKTGLSYINFGYGTGTNNCGELAFNYTSSESANNYASLSLYGGNNTLYIYPSYTKSIKEIRAPRFVGDLTGDVTGSATKLGGIEASKYVTSDFTNDPKTIGKLPYVVSDDNVLRDGNLKYFTYLIPDGGGRNTFTLIAKLSNWKVGTNSSYALIGTIYGHRAGNAARTGVHTIVAQAVSYSTLATQKLYVDNNRQFVLQPYIVSYTKTDENGNRETANYLALKKIGSGDPIHFIGFTKDLLPLNEWIDLVCPDSNSLPTDMTIVASPALNAIVLTTNQIYDGNATRTILHSGNYTTWININNFPGLNKTGTVTSVKIGDTSYSPSSGVVGLPAYPTSLKSPTAIKFKNTAGTVVSYDGSSEVDLTSGVNYAAGATNLLIYKSLPSGVYTTVKAVKDQLKVEFGNIKERVGSAINIPHQTIANWNNESFSYNSGGIYTAIKLSGGYSGNTYGLWLLSAFGDERLYYVGLFNGAWTPLRQIAITSDIPTTLKNPHALTFAAGTFSAKTYDGSAAVTVNVPTKTSHLTNDNGYLTNTSNLITITKTISVSNEWNDTGIYLDSATFTDGTGSYMVLVSVSNHYFWTGVLSVILSTGVTSTASNEILMHGGGFDTSQASHLYLRTIGEKESGKFKILIARHSNFTLTYTFKFKKII